VHPLSLRMPRLVDQPDEDGVLRAPLKLSWFGLQPEVVDVLPSGRVADRDVQCEVGLSHPAGRTEEDEVVGQEPAEVVVEECPEVPQLAAGALKPILDLADKPRGHRLEAIDRGAVLLGHAASPSALRRSASSRSHAMSCSTSSLWPR